MAIPTIRTAFRPEVARKAIHLAAGCLPLMYAHGVQRSTLLAMLGAAAAVALAVEGVRHVWPGAESLFEQGVGWMLRERERQAVTAATWLALASLAAVLWLPADAATATLWCATIADPAASIAGGALRRSRSPGFGKTRTGSAAFVVAAFVGTWLVAGFAAGPALAIAVGAALAERFPGPFDDNLTVSVGAALMATVVA